MPPMARFLPDSGYNHEDAKARTRPIIRALDLAYPESGVALNYSNAFQLLISVIMSAQTTDAMVNQVTPALFERYPDAEALSQADPSEVERLIHSTGFFRQKTKSIIGCSRKLVEEFDGEVPANMSDLTSLPGAARKTANVVLANLRPHPASDHGIYVDTHIRRTSQRLALTPHEDPDKIEQDLMELFPRKRWADAPHKLILLGRGPCNAKKPSHADCPLLKWCPTGLSALGIKPKKTKRG